MQDDLRRRIAKDLGVPEMTRRALDIGSRHSYLCRCPACWTWWRLVGPNPNTREYGPFTRAEMQQDLPPAV